MRTRVAAGRHKGREGPAASAELADGWLVSLRIAGFPTEGDWFVVRLVEKVLLPPAQAFVDFLSHEAVRFLPRALEDQMTGRDLCRPAVYV